MATNPLAIATDDFNRADGDVGSDWSASSSAGSSNKPDVSSNQLKPQASGEDEIAYYSAKKFDYDQYSQVVFSNVETSSSSGVVVRARANDWISYEKNTSNNLQRIIWYNAGAFSVLGSYAGAFADGDVIRLEVEGSTLRAYQNGVLRITVTNSGVFMDYDSGGAMVYAGVKLSESSTTLERMDNWEGGNLYQVNRIRSFNEGSTQAGVSNYTKSVDIDSLDNSVLYVVVGSRDGTVANLPVSSMTFDGVAMSRVRQDLYNASMYVKSEIWRLANPHVGNGLTLSITHTGTVAYSRVEIYHVMSTDIDYPVLVNAGTDGYSSNATSVTQNITPTQDEVALLTIAWLKDNTDPTLNSGQIHYGNASPNAGDDRYITDIKRVAIRGATSVGYSWTNADGYALSCAVLTPARQSRHPAVDSGALMV